MIHSCERSTRWIPLPLLVQRQISILDMRPFGSTERVWQLNTSFASSKTLSQTWPLARSLESSFLRYSVYLIWLIENTLIEGRWLLENVNVLECLSVGVETRFIFFNTGTQRSRSSLPAGHIGLTKNIDGSLSSTNRQRQSQPTKDTRAPARIPKRSNCYSVSE